MQAMEFSTELGVKVWSIIFWNIFVETKVNKRAWKEKHVYCCAKFTDVFFFRLKQSCREEKHCQRNLLHSFCMIKLTLLKSPIMVSTLQWRGRNPVKGVQAGRGFILFGSLFLQGKYLWNFKIRRIIHFWNRHFRSILRLNASPGSWSVPLVLTWVPGACTPISPLASVACLHERYLWGSDWGTSKIKGKVHSDTLRELCVCWMFQVMSWMVFLHYVKIGCQWKSN